MATSAGQNLARTHLFSRAVADWALSQDDRLALAHERAKAIASTFDLTIEDILTCSEKFWNSHIEPINTLDGGATTLWTIHLNLACGTVAQFANNRRLDLQELCRKFLAFEVFAQYMVTEVAHGLDTQNMETRVMLLPDGTLDLHTPNPGAAKFMPPTLPAGGVPRFGVVMARFIIGSTDCGIRSFVVPLNDGVQMHSGISCRLMPWRVGTRPVGHSITTFNHVNLPSTALLDPLTSHLSPRVQFLNSIWRLGIGSATISATAIPGLRLSAYITATYSKRRLVTNTLGDVVPTISFRTTQIPIVRALAQAAVLEALFREIRVYFTGQPACDSVRTLEELQIRNAFAAIFKTTSVAHFRASNLELMDRLGAQGLYVENQLLSFEQEVRGMAIAEGDVTVLCIRLASELLLGRYTVPAARNSSSPLALHERGIFIEMQDIFKSIGGKYRSEDFNRLLLPRAGGLVLAIGYRIAYEAAVSAGVRPELVDLYEAGAIASDVSWYVENQVFTRKEALEREDAAVTAAYEILDALLDETGVEPYVQAPVVTQEGWEKWVERMPLLHSEPTKGKL